MRNFSLNTLKIKNHIKIILPYSPLRADVFIFQKFHHFWISFGKTFKISSGIMAGENGETNELVQQVNDLKVPSEESAPDEAERSLLQKVIRKGLVENKNDIEVQRKDPKSPLYSVKSFEALNLKPSLLKGVYGT